ncbi:MAG: AIPR family protein [Polaromonas sp.]|uniref:AIPR family protein n=1 Tax=Polaromonas sp. TaxID=1869339 RepID=UPI00272EF861|nr:AIPR family protein [Polaromonas sp.]MDP2257562.1 AIPR family protein [Polaromonas sp.]
MQQTIEDIQSQELEASWRTALDEHDDLKKFGANAIGLFALALRFDLEDLEGVGVSSIVDGSSDKKNDLIFIDEEIGTAVIIQAYVSKSKKSIAPANKASDLNTAIAWLITMPAENLPQGIRSHAIRIRDGVNSGTITKIHVWYVHNCTESKNVADELEAVKQTLSSALAKHHKNANVKQFVTEIGNSTLTEWYNETQSPIAVNENISFNCTDGFEVKTNDWTAFITTISARDLYDAYKTHSVKLFSANIRDYLGARSSQSNINNGIRQTISQTPENFWVFNNGLTALTHRIEFDKEQKTIKAKGLAIVNGAQTTGAIGSMDEKPADNAMVPIRFVSVNNGDRDLVRDIVRYNNSQNQVTAADFRSTDAIQKRLRQEVAKIKDAEYEGGRRGGFGSAIKRKPKLMPSFTVGQALAAFHGQPSTAYNKKSDIWNNDALYSEFFNEKTTGPHLVFVFSLLKSIESSKSNLIEKSKSEIELTTLEKQRLEFFRLPASIFVYIHAIASALETIISRPISDYFTLSFGNQTAPKTAIKNWSPIISATAPFTRLLAKSISEGLSKTSIEEGIQNFTQQVEVAAESQTVAFNRFLKQLRNPSSTKTS